MMINKSTVFSLACAVGLFASFAIDGAPSMAFAQSSTSGAISGTAKETSTGEGLIGVTVVATSPALQGSQSAITEGGGSYRLTNLPVGIYTIKFYYAESTVTRAEISISINKVTPVHVKFDTSKAGGEEIIIRDSAPTIDPTSTNQGITLNEDYTKNIPIPTRSFEGALSAAAGSSDDALGVSFSGSTSLENSYVVDGVNTTGLTFGTLGSPVVNEFIKELEVITGGYQAEYGRATGAVVQAVTFTGTNEFHGTVFTDFRSSLLSADFKPTFNSSSSLTGDSEVAYNAQFGFRLGGPIIKDKLWFAVGFAPVLSGVDLIQINRRRSDCRMIDPATGASNYPVDQPCSQAAIDANSNGDADVDPETGFFIFEELSRNSNRANTQIYNFFSKINYSLSPEHQGQASVSGRPANQEVRGIGGDPVALTRKNSSLTTDVSLKWTSKFNNAKTEVEGVFGWHRNSFKTKASNPLGNILPLEQFLSSGGNDAQANIGVWSGLGFEDMATTNGCRDSGDATEDPYPGIINCPATGYSIGGIGNLTDDTEGRISARIDVTQRANLFGNHEIKGGIDVEDNRASTPRQFSGGAFYQNFVGVQVRDSRWVQIAGPNETDGRFDQTCGINPTSETGEPYACDFLEPGDDAAKVKGNTFNWALYLRDSWQVLPNLTLNIGLRYEEQRLRYSKELQNKPDPLTNRELGKNALELTNMWAPRLGISYDWTKEGRSKVYASWGRYFSSIPMRINDRSFGGETFLRRDIAATACGGNSPGLNFPKASDCPADAPTLAETVFGTGVLVAPGVKPMHLDEALLGVEYEVLEDLKVSLAYNNRTLGRVLEDVSTDNAVTYIIANPGEFDEGEEDKLMSEIDSLALDSPERLQKEAELEQFQRIRIFDKPKRDYQAITLKAEKRFSRDLFVQGSYTYSQTSGNFPGLFSADNGQVDPNITSQYDLIELLANRDGPLPQDRPHAVILEGYYRWRLPDIGIITPGASIRANSGIAKNTLARHYLYGQNESFLLPRGEVGRTAIFSSFDFHLGYARELGGGMEIEVYADVFNILNRQQTRTIDRAYTFNSANPIVGGEYRDLIWAKQLDGSGGETNAPVTRNNNYGNTASRYAPFSSTLGARLSF